MKSDLDLDIEAGSAALRRAMERSGLSQNGAAQATRGVVSPTSVRGYLAGKRVTVPRIVALARVFGRDAVDVLRAYGLDAAAEALEEEPGGGVEEDVAEDDPRLDAIEARLSAIEARLSSLERRRR